MFELQLCETREYSPKLLEHWLHTIQKKSARFVLQENNQKIHLFCSEDLTSLLVGSSCTAASAAGSVPVPTAAPNPAPPLYTLHQNKGPLLPIKRYSQFEDRTQKTHIAPLDHYLHTLAQTPNAVLTFDWTPLPERKRKRALKKAKRLHFEPERTFDQWESRAWFSLSLRRLLGPLIRRCLPLKPPKKVWNKRVSP